VSLARILGGSLLTHRAQQFQEGERPLFETTITVQLQQLDAQALSTTVERLTGVIAPMLTRDQATFHISVTPTVDKPDLQGLLRLQERDAA
jgi:hypothetical protein